MRVCVGVKRYEREVSNTCLTKKENGRNCMIEEISHRHFKCNEKVSERRTRKPDKISRCDFSGSSNITSTAKIRFVAETAYTC